MTTPSSETSVVTRDWPDSSLIASTNYNLLTRTLVITFATNGDSYGYDNVTTDDYEALTSAESIGKFFMSTFKHQYIGSKHSNPEP